MPQPEGELRPGLAVTYSYGRQVHVDDIEVLRNPVIGKRLRTSRTGQSMATC